MSTSAGRVLMIPKGNYDAAETYTMLDVVSYQGKSYVAKQTTTGNAPTDTTYWQLMIDAQGHTIKDPTTIFPNRANLVFDGFWLEDDSANDATIIYKNNPIPLVSWSTGTDAEIKAMVDAYYAGKLTLEDIQSVWSIGDEREVTLSAMAATGVDESHVAQTVKFVIMNFGGKKLASDGTTDVLAIVGQKNLLASGSYGEVGYMNSTNTNNGGWNSCARRTWCNSVYKNAVPETLRVIFKEFNNVTANGQYNTAVTSADYFALPSEKEVFGTTTYANATAEASNSQFSYYATSANRIKKYGESGSAERWWERSPNSSSSIDFCRVSNDGSANSDHATDKRGLAPFGCI